MPAVSWLNSGILRAYALEDRRAMSHTTIFLFAAVLGGILGTLAQHPSAAPAGSRSERAQATPTAGAPDRAAASVSYRGSCPYVAGNKGRCANAIAEDGGIGAYYEEFRDKLDYTIHP